MPVLNHLTLGRYLPGESLFHRLDPRVKLGALAALVGILFLSRSLGIQLGLLVFLTLCGIGSRLPLQMILGNLRPLIPILALTLFFHAFWTPGQVLFTFPDTKFALTWQGLQQGIFLSLRLSSLVIGTALLTLTTSPLELADGLERIFRPFQKINLPVHELALTLTIALRFIPILVDEANRIYEAQLSRGADFSGHPVRRLKRFMPLLLPLFVAAFHRAERLAFALTARCYQGDASRTQFRPLVLTSLDYAVLSGVFLLTALILIPTFL
ncbi:MAG: energy-coupling factor transporter transmembrane component T [bacterium]|nr:energy-coupling factor transporter transmembrane component T [bacterium]